MSNHKKLWLTALCLMTAPAEAEALISDPRFDQATMARNAGDFIKAVQLLEEIDSEHPNDPTTLRLLGSAYAAGGDYILAIDTLKRARLLALQDQDIALALGRVMIWSRRLDDAETVANEISLAQPDNVELLDLRQLLSRARQMPANNTRISLSHTLSWVKIGNSKADWTETVVSINAPVAARTKVVGEIDVENRAGTADTRFVGQIDRRFTHSAAIYLAGSFTTNPDFREVWSLRAGGEVQIFANVALMGALRHADYGSSNVTAFEPGVRVQSANGRASITVQSINFWAERNDYRNGWSARTNLEFWQAWLLSAGAATYPDTEAGQTRRVRSFFGAVTAPLTDRLNVRLGADYEKRIGSYHRTGVTLGIAWRFSP